MTRFSTLLLVVALFLMGTGVAQAELLFEDNFTGTGTVEGSAPDTVVGDPDGIWETSNATHALMSLNGGRAVLAGNGTVSTPRIHTTNLNIPAFGSGQHLEVLAEVSGTAGGLVGRGEIRFVSGGDSGEFLLPGFGNAYGTCTVGEYCAGGWLSSGGDQGIDTDVPLPVYNAEANPSHVVRIAITATGSDVEFDWDLNIDGGGFTDLADESYSYGNLGGTSSADPGSFSQIRFVNQPGSYRSFDYLRVSAVPEPTSLAMLGLGCMFLGARPWRRRQRS